MYWEVSGCVPSHQTASLTRKFIELVYLHSDGLLGHSSSEKCSVTNKQKTRVIGLAD